MLPVALPAYLGYNLGDCCERPLSRINSLTYGVGFLGCRLWLPTGELSTEHTYIYSEAPYRQRKRSVLAGLPAWELKMR